jgi:hypothetical protein
MHMHTLVTLHDIMAGEPLTAKYMTEGYHEHSLACGCTSCNTNNQPNAPCQSIDLTKFLPRSGQKRPCGGRRAKAKKRKLEEAPKDHLAGNIG